MNVVPSSLNAAVATSLELASFLTLSALAVVVGAFVGVVQAIEGIGDHPHRDRQRKEISTLARDAQDALQALAIEVLHREEVLPVVLADLHRLHAVRMIELGGKTRLIDNMAFQRR